MKKALVAALFAATAFTATHASAASIDLTDEVFVAGSVTYNPSGPINGFAEQSSGVNFTFATGGQFRTVGAWNGGVIQPANPALAFGGGGGNTTTFSLTVSEDISLTAFAGFAQQFNTGAIFDVTGTGVSSTGNAFGTSAFLGTGTPVSTSFVGGPLSLTAGEVYTFKTTNGSASTVSFFTGFEFSIAGATPAVPLPAGLPLLAGGLGAFAWLRRRKG